MSKKPTDQEKKQMLSYGFVWDEVDNDFVAGYQTDLRRVKVLKIFSSQMFSTSGAVATSSLFHVFGYHQFKLLVDVGVTGTPTDLQIYIQFSDDMANWYNYVNGPFGSLFYTAASGDRKECLDGKLLPPYIRSYVVSTGCDSSNTFSLSLKAVISDA